MIVMRFCVKEIGCYKSHSFDECEENHPLSIAKYKMEMDSITVILDYIAIS